MSKNKEKIGFLSVIITIVGSSIGAGIFFKNKSILENTHGSIGLAISCWIVAAIGILAIGLALMEITSTQDRDKGILGWMEKFTPNWMFKWSKGYMLILYFPLTFATLPVYGILSLEDATGWTANWWQMLLVATSFMIWFGAVSFFSLKFGSSLQWIFTLVKFIPILFIPLFGFLNLDSNNVSVTSVTTGLTGISPYLGVIAAIPAIFFAYDGFYTVTSLKSKMKKPKLMPLAIAIGIGAITSMYLLITAGVLIGSEDGAKNVYSNKAFKMVMDTFIFVAILGVINGFSLGTYNIYDEYIETDDFAFSSFFKKIKTKEKRIGKITLRGTTPGFNILMIFSFIFIIIIFFVGAFVWPTQNKVEGISELTDLLTNWTSLLVFLMISFAIMGALVNRKTNKIKVKKSKIFIPSAIISIILTTIPGIYMIVASIVDMTGFNKAGIGKATTTFIVLIATIIISCIPLIIEKVNKKIKNNKLKTQKKLN
ncbi:APC family permease [Mycoplasma marinum]|nr:APC family permease [Mycoplasma marinum]